MVSLTENPSLTERLLSLDQRKFQKATQAPFLVKVGKGTLPKKVVDWWREDRSHTQDFLGFGGDLLSAWDMPSKVDPEYYEER